MPADDRLEKALFAAQADHDSRLKGMGVLDDRNPRLLGPQCSICGELIQQGELYYAGIISNEVAASLMDTDNPLLVPAWTELPDGTVELAICRACEVGLVPEAKAVLVGRIA